ncbi:MAG: DOMON-like domain-containing protein [Zoogloeaceae bacterium]|jgi:hypothetical protein|nr:DOMON-like domain-containing protein [Zoogloeaceae bacterium]
MKPPRFSAAFSTMLRAHPDFPAPEMEAIEVAATRDAAGLYLDYDLRGNLSAFRFPAPEQNLTADQLWAHSCCEVFLATAETRAYREYNFSPNGQWAVFDFSDYRQRAASPALPAPEMRWQHAPNLLNLQLHLPAALLPADPLQLALAVVLENVDARLAYYALQHPAGQPDFHHPDNFTLRLS